MERFYLMTSRELKPIADMGLWVSLIVLVISVVISVFLGFRFSIGFILGSVFMFFCMVTVVQVS